MRYESVLAVNRRLVNSINDGTSLVLIGHCLASPDPIPDLVDLVDEVLFFLYAHDSHFLLLGLSFLFFLLELDRPEGKLDVWVGRRLVRQVLISLNVFLI